MLPKPAYKRASVELSNKIPFITRNNKSSKNASRKNRYIPNTDRQRDRKNPYEENKTEIMDRVKKSLGGVAL